MDGYKRCGACQLWKLRARFSPSKRSDGCNSDGLHNYCKDCRNAKAKARNASGLRPDRCKRAMTRGGDKSPTAWIRPRDDRPIHDKLRDVQMREWANDYATPGPLVPAIGWRVYDHAA